MTDYKKVALKAYNRIALVVDNLEDEGDRVYLGSTNDADILRSLNDERDAHLIMGEEILTLEQEVANLRENYDAVFARAERLEAALREIAADASVPVRTKKKGGIKHKWMYKGWRKIAVERIDIARTALKGDDQ